MPVKNVEKYIKQALGSILNQTFKYFELLIIDDSTDNTSNIIRNIKDSRIKHLIFEGNIPQKLNYGLELSKGELIARMDGDDMSHEQRLEKQIAFLKSRSNIDILGTNFSIIDQNGKLICEKKYPEYHDDIEYMMPIITSVLHPTMMIYRNILIEVNGYNENMIHAEDTELFLRCLGKYTFYNLQETLYNYRITNISNSRNRYSDTYSYKIGNNYILNCIKENPDTYTQNTFRLGMLEYYKNDISISRRLFLSVFFKKNINKIKLIRYLIPSLFGNYVLGILRRSGFLSILNRFLLKLTNYDSNIVKDIV